MSDLHFFNLFRCQTCHLRDNSGGYAKLLHLTGILTIGLILAFCLALIVRGGHRAVVVPIVLNTLLILTTLIWREMGNLSGLTSVQLR